jgi:hypothetical protein
MQLSVLLHETLFHFVSFSLHLALPCISQDLEEDMNQTLSLEAGLLFVLDESGSVTREDFEKTKTFVANIINRFP